MNSMGCFLEASVFSYSDDLPTASELVPNEWRFTHQSSAEGRSRCPFFFQVLCPFLAIARTGPYSFLFFFR